MLHFQCVGSTFNVSYKSARNHPTNCTCGLFYELCRECVGKFLTKVPGFFRQY